MTNQKQLNQMLRQAQRMQEDMAQAQAALLDERIEASAGGGMVRAVVNGVGELQAVTISPEVVDPEDVEMLEDLVVAAVTEAGRAAQALQSERMGAITGGMGSIPGLLG